MVDWRSEVAAPTIHLAHSYGSCSVAVSDETASLLFRSVLYIKAILLFHTSQKPLPLCHTIKFSYSTGLLSYSSDKKLPIVGTTTPVFAIESQFIVPSREMYHGTIIWT